MEQLKERKGEQEVMVFEIMIMMKRRRMMMRVERMMMMMMRVERMSVVQ